MDHHGVSGSVCHSARLVMISRRHFGASLQDENENDRRRRAQWVRRRGMSARTVGHDGQSGPQILYPEDRLQSVPLL